MAQAPAIAKIPAQAGLEGGIAAPPRQGQQNQWLVVRPSGSCVPVLCPEVEQQNCRLITEKDGRVTQTQGYSAATRARDNGAARCQCCRR